MGKSQWGSDMGTAKRKNNDRWKSMEQNINPNFVIGTGRCGLTPLMDLVAYHEEFSWPSNINDRFPNHLLVSYLSRIVELPFFKSSFKFRRFVPKHNEVYNFWDTLFFGFRRPFRDINKWDVNSTTREKFIIAINKIAKYQGKNQFIAEYAGWSRIGFLNEIFPKCRFIHIVRDGRAVANSLTTVDWWWGWQGMYKWRWGTLNQELYDIWKHYDFSFLALAAIQWKITVNNILMNSEKLPSDRLLLVRYEDMVEHPKEIAKKCIRFMGINENSKKFNKHLNTVKIIDANNNNFRIPSWKDSLSKNQIEMLNKILQEDLNKLSYKI